MKIKTSEFTGAALDWAVAKALGIRTYVRMCDHTMTGRCVLDAALVDMEVDDLQELRYSRDWAQGGPIIEREGVNLGTQRNEPGFRSHPDFMWHAQMDTRVYVGYGPTPLIAAMRCFVASKLGDEVDVPEELL